MSSARRCPPVALPSPQRDRRVCLSSTPHIATVPHSLTVSARARARARACARGVGVGVGALFRLIFRLLGPSTFRQVLAACVPIKAEQRELSGVDHRCRQPQYSPRRTRRTRRTRSSRSSRSSRTGRNTRPRAIPRCAKGTPRSNPLCVSVRQASDFALQAGSGAHVAETERSLGSRERTDGRGFETI